MKNRVIIAATVVCLISLGIMTPDIAGAASTAKPKVTHHAVTKAPAGTTCTKDMKTCGNWNLITIVKK